VGARKAVVLRVGWAKVFLFAGGAGAEDEAGGGISIRAQMPHVRRKAMHMRRRVVSRSYILEVVGGRVGG